MRRVTLLFNPAAGRRRGERLQIVERIAASMLDLSCEVGVIPTQAPGRAGEQAREACERGAEIVFACGGDGTIHEVLPGMVFQPHASLGIIPLGSANALARHLGVSRDPVRAAVQQLRWQSRLLPVGQVTYTCKDSQASRYFAVMAGAGADGALVYRMLSRNKERFGRASYYVRAVLMVLGSRFPSFDVRMPTEQPNSLRSISAMAVRVGDLGGAFSPLVRGGSLEQMHNRVAVATGSSHLSLSSWFALAWLGLGSWNRHVHFADTPSFEASAGEGNESVQVQADGEWLGRTPMSVSVVPDALRLIVPDGPI